MVSNLFGKDRGKHGQNTNTLHQNAAKACGKHWSKPS